MTAPLQVTPSELYASGDVQRWHARPALARLGQTNADHQGRCAQLLLMLHPGPSAALLTAALTHDAPEFWVGDTPYNAKTRWPRLALALAEAESEVARLVEKHIPRARQGGDGWRWIKFVDRLEPYLYVRQHRPDLLLTGEWIALARWLRSEAAELGVDPERMADLLNPEGAAQ